jgi:hypothetical protein
MIDLDLMLDEAELIQIKYNDAFVVYKHLILPGDNWFRYGVSKTSFEGAIDNFNNKSNTLCTEKTIWI